MHVALAKENVVRKRDIFRSQIPGSSLSISELSLKLQANLCAWNMITPEIRSKQDHNRYLDLANIHPTVKKFSSVMGSTSVTSTGQYLVTPKVLERKIIEVSEPGDNEVQITPRSTTICGSDLHYYSHGRNGSILVREPLCLGHESAGVVVQVGKDVKNLQIGDEVAVECGVPCSQCNLCIEGRYNLCPKLRFRSSGSIFPHFQGTLQERINHPAGWTHKLPANFRFEDGALLEPLAVACHSVRRAGIKPGSSCLIVGAGAVGLLCAAVARFHGCKQIVISDIDSRRVNFAVQEGFAEVGYTGTPKRAGSVDEDLTNARGLASEIGSQLWADGSSVGRLNTTFECTGVPSCVQASIYATRSGGRVMLVGMGTPNYVLPISEASAREIDLMPVWRYAHCYEEAIEVMSMVIDGSFKPDIRKLITHRFEGLENVEKAFQMASSSQDMTGEIVIKVTVNTESS